MKTDNCLMLAKKLFELRSYGALVLFGALFGT